MKILKVAAIVVGLPCFITSTRAQDTTNSAFHCPLQGKAVGAPSHQAIVHKHGNEAMGFDHDTTTHHFLISQDGGVIQVTANDSADKNTIEAIRLHLSHITSMFANGDFSIAMFVHDDLPPGVTAMKLLQERIQYSYQEMPSGGRVRIKSKDAIAIAAIHDFLRYQIKEHQTGDTLATVDNR